MLTSVDQNGKQVVKTGEVLGSFTQVAEKIDERSKEYSEAIRDTANRANALKVELDKSNECCDTVFSNVETLQEQITTKGIIYENMENVLQQFTPLMKNKSKI